MNRWSLMVGGLLSLCLLGPGSSQTAEAAEVVFSKVGPGGTSIYDFSRTAWGNGWKILLYQSVKGPNVVGYRPSTGALSLEALNVSGGKNTNLGKRPGAPDMVGFTHLETIQHPTGLHVVLYRQGDGAARILRIGGGTFTQTYAGNWSPGWSHMEKFRANGVPHLLLYSSLTGRVHIDLLKPAGAGATILWKGNWEPGYSHLAPFLLNTIPHMLQYRVGDGAVKIDILLGRGGFASTLWSGRWKPGWIQFDTFRQQGVPYVLEYKFDGTAVIDRINFDGRGTTELFRTNWGPGWTNVSAFNLGNEAYVVRVRDN
jgi:hypothetical protein